MVCRIGCHPNVRRKIGVIAYPAVLVEIPHLDVQTGLYSRLVCERLIWNGVRGVLTLMVMIGASMAIIGAFRLWVFLKANPRRQETEA